MVSVAKFGQRYGAYLYPVLLQIQLLGDSSQCGSARGRDATITKCRKGDSSGFKAWKGCTIFFCEDIKTLMGQGPEHPDLTLNLA